MSALSSVRSRLDSSSWRFSRSTATLTATTPARSTANRTIQTTPPPRPTTAASLGAQPERGVRTRAPCATVDIRRAPPPAAAPSSRAGSRRPRARTAAPASASGSATSGSRPQTQTGKLRRARAAARPLAQEALHDPVLERVEADHREPTARPKHLECRGKARLERLELVVDLDAERLEDALRRMPLAEAGRRGDRRPDDVDELAGALDRALGRAVGRSRARSGARSALRRTCGRSSRARARRTSRRSSAALSSSEGSIRMSSGASVAYEKPRSGRSICIELRPRSSRTASARTPFPASCERTTAKSPRRKRVCTPRAEALTRSKYGRTVGSRSMATSLPLPCRSAATRRECPPAPKVASTTVSPGCTRGARAPPRRAPGRDQLRLSAARSATSPTLPSIALT